MHDYPAPAISTADSNEKPDDYPAQTIISTADSNDKPEDYPAPTISAADSKRQSGRLSCCCSHDFHRRL